MRNRPTELTLIAVYQFVVAAMLLIAACVILPISLVVYPFTTDGLGDFFGGLALLGGLLMLTFGVGLASVLIGFGLLLRRPWARIGAIVLAVLALFAFPIGTIFGILVIYYLVSDEGEGYFKPSTQLPVAMPPTMPPARHASTETPAPLITSSPPAAEPSVVEPAPPDLPTIETRAPNLERKAEIRPIEPDEPRQD